MVFDNHCIFECRNCVKVVGTVVGSHSQEQKLARTLLP